METACTVVKSLNPYHVVAGAAAQYVFGMLWFGVIVNHLYRYYYAADKGVRRPEHAVCRYPSVVVALANAAAAVARSVVVMAIAATYKASTIQEYQCAAVIAAIIFSISTAKYVADQRPFALIVVEGGHEVVSAMIAAVVPFYMAVNGI